MTEYSQEIGVSFIVNKIYTITSNDLLSSPKRVLNDFRTIKAKNSNLSEKLYPNQLNNNSYLYGELSKIKVKRQYVGEFVGIEVDKDNLFLLEDFTIVHNSADIINIEEPGKFSRLVEAFPISFEPLIRDGETFIGNVIAGQSKFDKEYISWVKPTSKKECIHIKCNSNFEYFKVKKELKCSVDHPLMVVESGIIKFKLANELAIGDNLAYVLDSFLPKKNYPFAYSNLNKKGPYFIGKEFKNIAILPVTELLSIGIHDVYNLTADTTHSYITNGFISANTAGDLEGGGSAGLHEMLYKPSKFGFKAYDNIYEEIETNEKVGWFINLKNLLLKL